MKKLTFIIILAIALISCKQIPNNPNNVYSEKPTETNEPTRIHIIEGNAWTYFQIIEVDGHEYLSNSNHGGIVHLESCPCKTK